METLILMLIMLSKVYYSITLSIKHEAYLKTKASSNEVIWKMQSFQYAAVHPTSPPLGD